MALVSIEQWRRERGIEGGLSAAGLQAELAERPAAPADVSIASLQETISYQAELIVKLQTALRIYLEREEREKRQAVAASMTPKTGRVVRRKKLAQGKGSQGELSPPPGGPTPAPITGNPGPKVA